MQNISLNLCSYMFAEFPSAFNSPFGRELLVNVIEESEKIELISERCEWLAKILPEVTLSELRDVMLR